MFYTTDLNDISSSFKIENAVMYSTVLCTCSMYSEIGLNRFNNYTFPLAIVHQEALISKKHMQIMWEMWKKLNVLYKSFFYTNIAS